jgi:hypothetical protein
MEVGAVPGVEKPLVGAKGAVQPERMSRLAPMMVLSNTLRPCGISAESSSVSAEA